MFINNSVLFSFLNHVLITSRGRIKHSVTERYMITLSIVLNLLKPTGHVMHQQV
jgi:hypothetical protein